MKNFLLIFLVLTFFVYGTLYADLNQIDLKNTARQILHNPSISEFFRMGISQSRDMKLAYIIEQDAMIEFDRETIWLNDNKVRFSYDEEGMIKNIYNYGWDDVSELWEQQMMVMEIIWNEIGLFEKAVYKFYVPDLEEWIPVMELTQTYNDLNHIDGIDYYFLFAEEPELMMSIDFFYDEWDFAVEMLYQTYDQEERDTEMRLNSFYYDGSQRIQKVIEQYFDNEGNQWEIDYKSEMTYHSNDTSTYDNFQSFIDDFGLYMMGVHVNIFPFMVEQEEHYQMGDLGWELVAQTLYQYNDDDLLEMITEQDLLEELWVTVDRELYYYDNLQLSEIVYQWLVDEDLVDGERRLYFMAEASSVDEYLSSLPSIAVKNYPNPFNPQTTISFSIPSSSKLELSVFNIKGQRVTILLNEIIESGNHSVSWNGKDDDGNELSSGIYFYRLSNGVNTVTGKMLMLK